LVSTRDELDTPQRAMGNSVAGALLVEPVLSIIKCNSICELIFKIYKSQREKKKTGIGFSKE
jgi:hypothetical protein